MQQYFFFLLVLFLCFSASAQTHSSEAQKIFDTAVNSYNTGNVPEAEALFKKAEEAAKKEKNHEIWWACYNYYGAIAIGKKDFDKGIEFFWKAFYIALEGDHIENLQFLIKNVAAGYANKGDMTAAQKYANISELFKAATEIEIKAQETFNQGRIKEGIQLYVDAFQYYKDAGIDKVTANILIFLTHIMMKNGFCNDAYLRFEDAQRYDLSFMINNEGIADTFYAIGLCDGNKGDYEAVCVKWEKALQYAQKSNNKENLLFYKKELAIAYDNAKRYSYAIAMPRWQWQHKEDTS